MADQRWNRAEVDHFCCLRKNPFGQCFRGIFGRREKKEGIRKGEEGGKDGELRYEMPVLDQGEPIRNRRLFGQNYEEIKASCLMSRELFTDPEVNNTSLFSFHPSRPLTWKRPHEFVKDPQLFVDGAGRFDINQGKLGDCWMLAAMANLSMNQKVFDKVVPPGQKFEEDYAGIFLFKFWQYGEWVDVVVDDYLPTEDGINLFYIKSHNRNEFWSALMEKAYAKLHGTYLKLKSGNIGEAMVDFSGGCYENYSLKDTKDYKIPKDLYHRMLKAHKRKSLIGCSKDQDPKAITDSGLGTGHAYSVTKVLKAKIETEKGSDVIPLVRVRNPWGNKTEWNGAWSDRNKEWHQLISEEQKREMGLTFEDDGEWWMSYEDFKANFDQLELCNLSPDSLTDPDDEDVSWRVNSFHGAWVNGESAGGCRKELIPFLTNPQYRVTLVDVDEEDEDELCTLLVSLSQKGRRNNGLEMNYIGFAVYQIQTEDQDFDQDFVENNLQVPQSQQFINSREVTYRFKLEPGTYVVVPSTFYPNISGEFLLRLFTEKDASCHQYDNQNADQGKKREHVHSQDQTNYGRRNSNVVNGTGPTL